MFSSGKEQLYGADTEAHLVFMKGIEGISKHFLIVKAVDHTK